MELGKPSWYNQRSEGEEGGQVCQGGLAFITQPGTLQSPGRARPFNWLANLRNGGNDRNDKNGIPLFCRRRGT